MPSQTLKNLTVAAALMLTASTASATVVDLTVNNSGTVGGALFEWNASVNAGTGVFDPIVRIQAPNGNTEIEHGYNTSGRPVPFDEKTDLPHTHNLVFGDLLAVDVSGTDYYLFLLDINESNNFESFLSLNEIQIYTSAIGSQTTTDVSTLGTLRYDLDGIEDSKILLDHARTPGSGRTDMAMFVPASYFVGVLASDYVYLYSLFGADGQIGSGPNKQGFGASAGFEEWAALLDESPTDIPGVPAPAALPAGLALIGLALARRRR